MSTRRRELIENSDLVSVGTLDPLAGVDAISGVRVHHVGQGDCISILDDQGDPVFTIDYGGRQSNPFRGMKPGQVDARLPVQQGRLLMLTHWDEDHWCMAKKAAAVTNEQWLVPRQLTSPRAVRFTSQLTNIQCIPPTHDQGAFCFSAMNGDEIWFEKLAPSSNAATRQEDCNATGVAFSVVKKSDGKPDSVILLPGDAPFHKVKHYSKLQSDGKLLRGLVAFHHGSANHWTSSTEDLLAKWNRPANLKTVVAFSYGDPNSYGHPNTLKYSKVFGAMLDKLKIPESVGPQPGHEDILF